MLLNGLDGLLCRLLVYSTGLFGAFNQMVIEFSTLENVAPTSMLMCFNDTRISLSDTSFTVVSLREGGGLFNLNEIQVPISAFWATSTFFGNPAGSLGIVPAVYGNLHDFLSTDAYYGGSYQSQRGDDMIMDWRGQNITGILRFATAPSVDPQYQPVSNCVLLTGAWKAGTRYELTFQGTNPMARDPNSLDEPLPTVWIAPVTVQGVPALPALGKTEYLLTVRGNKYGALCALRSQAAVLGRLWDACKYLQSYTLSVAAYTSQQACASTLSALSTPARASVFPFTQPPLARYTVNSFAQTQCDSAPNVVLSLRYGGQCVDCGIDGLAVGGTLLSPCQCPANRQVALVGDQACGPYLTANAAAQSVAGIPAALCNTYSVTQTRWQNRTLPSRVVVGVLLKAFSKAAKLLMDDVDIRAANATFTATYIWDDRHPNSPTRHQGIAPSCNKCNGATTFKDVFQRKKKTPVYDNQFQAMNTFRLIGYVLDTVASFPCSALWDRSNPLQLNYGDYQDILCQPLPTQFRNYPNLTEMAVFRGM